MTTLTGAAPKVRRAPPPAPKLGAKARWIRRAPLMPALLFTIVVTQVPFVATLVISSLNWNILRPGERSFAALHNYGVVFTDGRLRTAVVNTITMTAGTVIVSLLIGLGLAILL